MTALTFIAEPEPGVEKCEQLAELAPENPFATPAFARAERRFSGDPWLLGAPERTHWRSVVWRSCAAEG